MAQAQWSNHVEASHCKCGILTFAFFPDLSVDMKVPVTTDCLKRFSYFTVLL